MLYRDPPGTDELLLGLTTPAKPIQVGTPEWVAAVVGWAQSVCNNEGIGPSEAQFAEIRRLALLGLEKNAL